MKIREATEDDLPALLSLYAQPGMDDGETLTLAQAQIVSRRMQSYPNYKLYVAVADDEAVGTFALLIMDNLGHLGKPSAVIEDVMVKPGRQRSGIGRSMMQFAMDLARNAGCYKVVLSSDLKRQGAHGFYESLGFRKHGYSFVVDLGE